MFVQTTSSSRKNGKTYLSFLVRESFRTADGPRSRTVCNITDLPAHTRQLIAVTPELPGDPRYCCVYPARRRYPARAKRRCPLAAGRPPSWPPTPAKTATTPTVPAARRGS